MRQHRRHIQTRWARCMPGSFARYSFLGAYWITPTEHLQTCYPSDLPAGHKAAAGNDVTFSVAFTILLITRLNAMTRCPSTPGLTLCRSRRADLTLIFLGRTFASTRWRFCVFVAWTLDALSTHSKPCRFSMQHGFCLPPLSCVYGTPTPGDTLCTA